MKENLQFGILFYRWGREQRIKGFKQRINAMNFYSPKSRLVKETVVIFQGTGPGSSVLDSLQHKPPHPHHCFFESQNYLLFVQASIKMNRSCKARYPMDDWYKSSQMKIMHPY